MIVLDSHAWFWWINQEYQRLSMDTCKIIQTADHVGVSPVSCYELALAHQKGRLDFTLLPEKWFGFALNGSGIELLPFNEAIAMRAVALSDIHRDPFDRIIIATALQLNAELVSVDGRFSKYPELKGILLS